MTGLTSVRGRYTLASVLLSRAPPGRFRNGTEQSPVLNGSVMKGERRILPARELFRLRSPETDHAGLIFFLSNNHFTGLPHETSDLKPGCFITALKAFRMTVRGRRLSRLPDLFHLNSGTGTFRRLRGGAGG